MELLCFLAVARAKSQFFPLYSLLIILIVGWCWNQCWKLNLFSEKGLPLRNEFLLNLANSSVKKAIWIFFHKHFFLNIFWEIDYNIFTNQQKRRFVRMRVEYTALTRKRTNNNTFKKSWRPSVVVNNHRENRHLYKKEFEGNPYLDLFIWWSNNMGDLILCLNFKNRVNDYNFKIL